jgi:hypothetical protein
MRNIDEEDRRLDHEVDESIRKMKSARKKEHKSDIKALTDESDATTRLASELAGKVGKPVRDMIEDQAQKLVAGGKSPADVVAAIMPGLVEKLQAQGAGKEAYQAANILARQAGERALGARLTVPGEMGAQEAAHRVIGADDAAEAAKAARKAGPAARRKAAAEKQQRLHDIEAGLMQQYDVTPAQAHMAAPQVQRKMDAGMRPRDAAESTLRAMQQYIQHQEMTLLRQEAQFERMSGMFTGATQRLMQIEAQMGRSQNNISRQSGLMPVFRQ